MTRTCRNCKRCRGGRNVLCKSSSIFALTVFTICVTILVKRIATNHSFPLLTWRSMPGRALKVTAAAPGSYAEKLSSLLDDRELFSDRWVILPSPRPRNALAESRVDIHPSGSTLSELRTSSSNNIHELSLLCKHNQHACRQLINQRIKVRKWKAFQSALRAQWRDEATELEKLRLIGAPRVVDTRVCPVRIHWKGDERIDQVLEGSIVRTLMDSASQQCAVGCVAAKTASDAHISMVLFDKDMRKWARRSVVERTSNSTEAPRLIARLNLEGQTSAFTQTVFNVPNEMSAVLGNGSRFPATSAVLSSMEIETDILVSLYPESDIQINYFFFVTELMHCGVHVTNVPVCILDYVRNKLPPVKQLHQFQYGYLHSDAHSTMARPVLASMFVSACETDGRENVRKRLLSQLMTKMGIHSYGRCLHSPGLSGHAVLLREGQTHLKRQAAKLFLASRYPFLISFENTIEDHYRTEKVFLSLLSGSVPVILSDPLVANVLPRNSFIDVHKFANMTSLAAFVDTVARSEDLYARYHEWRKHPDEIEKLFLRLYVTSLHSLGHHSMFCRMCKFYHNEYDPFMHRCP